MKRHEKLLARMTATRAGWNSKDFETLYTGFGFRKLDHGRDTKYVHAAYPELVACVSRSSGELSKCYARDAIVLIGRLKRLEEDSDV